MTRTAGRQLEGRHLLLGEYLRSWTTLNYYRVGKIIKLYLSWSNCIKIFEENSLLVPAVSTRKEKFRISKRLHNVLFIKKHQWNSKLFHFFWTVFVLAGKGAGYYVAIATAIFSHVKVSCFRGKAHLVFHWCLYNKSSHYLNVRII